MEKTKPKNAYAQESPEASPQVVTEQQQQQPKSHHDTGPRALGKAYTEMPAFETSPQSSKNSRFLTALLAAVLLGSLAIGYNYVHKTAQAKSSAPVAAAAQEKKTLIFTEAELDLKTTAEMKEKLQQGQAPALVVNSKPYPLNSVASRVINNPPQVVEKILNDEMQFYTINIFDSADEDGDVVQISVDGAVIGFVDMTNKGLKISIPLEKNKSKVITVKGIHDGGGGITFGAILKETSVVMDVFNVGETRDIPLGFK